MAHPLRRLQKAGGPAFDFPGTHDELGAPLFPFSAKGGTMQPAVPVLLVLKPHGIRSIVPALAEFKWGPPQRAPFFLTLSVPYSTRASHHAAA